MIIKSETIVQENGAFIRKLFGNGQDIAEIRFEFIRRQGGIQFYSYTYELKVDDISAETVQEVLTNMMRQKPERVIGQEFAIATRKVD